MNSLSDGFLSVIYDMLSQTVSNAVNNIQPYAYAILLITFILSIYQAYSRHGSYSDLVPAITKYVIAALVIANWISIFNLIAKSAVSIGMSIGQTTAVQDYVKSMQNAINSKNYDSIILSLLTQGIGALLFNNLLMLSLVVLLLGMVLVAFAYAVWGMVLCTIGPLLIATLPSSLSSDFAKAYIKGFIEWLSWPILLGILFNIFSHASLPAIPDSLTVGKGTTPDWGTLGKITGEGVAFGTYNLLAPLLAFIFACCIFAIPFIAHHILNASFAPVASAVMNTGKTAAAILAAAKSDGASAVAVSTKGGGKGSSGAPPTPSSSNGSQSGQSSSQGQQATPPPHSGSDNAWASQADPAAPPPSGDSGGGERAGTLSKVRTYAGGFIRGGLAASGRAALGMQGRYIASGRINVDQNKDRSDG